jgi:triosephosphate isomerase
MKYFFVNLKRFDIPLSYNGINRIAPVREWGSYIVKEIEPYIETLKNEANCVLLLPEAHVIPALNARREDSHLSIGAQGVHREDVARAGNFGGFTTLRTASAMAALGCTHVIIGHNEERCEKKGVLAEANVRDTSAVNRLLNREMRCAQQAGLKILYCVGEDLDEQTRWQSVIGEQLSVGLDGVDMANVVIGYEPVWAIGPGKPVPDAAYIEKTAAFIKQETNASVIYGGGMKSENAAMIASVGNIDGGLIALTRFSGEIGFYPGEFQAIIETYLSGGEGGKHT